MTDNKTTQEEQQQQTKVTITRPTGPGREEKRRGTARTDELLFAETLGKLGLHVNTQVAHELAARAAPVDLTEPLPFLVFVPADKESENQ